MRLRGFLQGGSADLLLSVKKSRQPLGPFYLPNGNSLRILESSRGWVVVSAEMPRHVEPSTPVNSTIACDDLDTRESLPLDEAYRVMGAVGNATELELLPGRVPLSTIPNGAIVAMLEVIGSRYVRAFQSSGTSRFILESTDDGSLFGWVPGATLTPPPSGPVGHGRGGVGVTWSGRHDPVPGPTCRAPVPLLARADGRLFEVGMIKALTPIPIGRILGEFVVVGLQHPAYERSDDPAIRERRQHFRIAAGAELLVRVADVRACEPGH